jgi:DNA repair protein RadC
MAIERPDESKPVIRSPLDVAMLLLSEMASLEQEELRVLLLNSRNEVEGMKMVYRGSVNSAHVRPSEVCREAVRANLPGIVVVHNHPSGDPTPSRSDISVTERIVEAGRLLDIEVMDHIVIGGGKFVSMRDQKQGFTSADQSG